MMEDAEGAATPREAEGTSYVHADTAGQKRTEKRAGRMPAPTDRAG